MKYMIRRHSKNSSLFLFSLQVQRGHQSSQSARHQHTNTAGVSARNHKSRHSSSSVDIIQVSVVKVAWLKLCLLSSWWLLKIPFYLLAACCPDVFLSQLAQSKQGVKGRCGAKAEVIIPYRFGTCEYSACTLCLWFLIWAERRNCFSIWTQILLPKQEAELRHVFVCLSVKSMSSGKLKSH